MAFKLILYAMYSSIVYYLSCWCNPNYTHHKKWIIDIYNFGMKYLGWSYIFHNLSKTGNNPLINEHIKTYKTPNKILLLVNHVNFMDAFFIQYLIATEYSEYTALYITKSSYAKIPILGPYLSKNHILINNNVAEDIPLINDRITELEEKHEKLLIVLFPEGGLRYPLSIEKSNSWCNRINIPYYKNTLAPRINGIYTVLNAFKPDCILQGFFNYREDIINNFKGINYSDILFDKLPKEVSFSIIDNTLHFKKISVEDHTFFTQQFYSYWKIYVDNKLTHYRFKNN